MRHAPELKQCRWSPIFLPQMDSQSQELGPRHQGYLNLLTLKMVGFDRRFEFLIQQGLFSHPQVLL